MWIDIKQEKPKGQKPYVCYGIVNIDTPFEDKARFEAFWNGEKFTDKDGEDLIGINEGVKYWWCFRDVQNPK